MSKYVELRQRQPILVVKKNAREIIVTTISCMCDNIHYIRIKKNEEGDFKIDTMGFSFSNWQFKYPKHDMEWAADEGKWDLVFKMINSGTSAISEIKCR